MMKGMRAYTAYSRACGPIEGCLLVIAHSAKEARRLAWQSGECFTVDDWLDLGVKWDKSDEYLKLAKLSKLDAGEPHVVARPLHCEACEFWGAGITVDNLCCNCGCYPGDGLVKRLRGELT